MLLFFQSHKKAVIFSGLVVGLILIGGISVTLGKRGNGFETAEVSRMNLVSEVSVTGKVRAAEDSVLSFERGGRLERVNVSVGDRVSRGDVLAVLSNTDQSADVERARAGLAAERARLDRVLSGTRTEDISISERALASANATLDNARLSLIERVRSSFVSANNAIKNNTDILFSNVSTSPSFGVSVTSGATTYLISESDSAKRSDINFSRKSINDIFQRWNSYILEDDIYNISIEVKGDLLFMQNFLSKVSETVNAYNDPGDVTTSAIYDSYKNSVALARSEISQTISALDSTIGTFVSARTSVDHVKSQLVSVSAPASSEDVRLAEAQVRAAEAVLSSSLSIYNKGVIRAPYNGLITRIDSHVGEFVGPGSPMIRMIGGNFQIEANIPEADIAKVSIGDIARVTLDAYGSSVLFEAVLSEINLAETIIDGVSTYKAVLVFTGDDDRIKVGMTANVDIVGERRQSVLAVPQRAVLNRENKRIVRRVNGNEVEEVEVVIGLRSSNGFVEIINGLEEGDIVITFMPR